VSDLIAGKPLNIAVPCAGLAPGSPVTIKVFEPNGLGGDPVETLQAKVDDEGGVAETSWTYDYSKYKEKTHGAVFVLLVEGGGRVTLSEPIEFQELFDAKIQDEAGHPAAHREVVLHADRGENIPAVTDATGRVKKLVPPGEYHVELVGHAPKEKQIPPHDPDEAAALAAEAAALEAGALAAAEAGHELWVQLVSVGGTPLRNERVQVVDASGEPVGDPVVADDDGVVRVPVDEGEYAVRILGPEGTDDADDGSAPQATEGDALVNEPALSHVLACRFFDASGQPIANESVSARSDQDSFSLTTDQAGRIEQTASPAAYDVTIRGQTFKAGAVLVGEKAAQGDPYCFLLADGASDGGAGGGSDG